MDNSTRKKRLEQAALDYLDHGLPITICNNKAPIGKAWQTRIWTPDEVRHDIPVANINVGLIWGPRSGIIDIEVDSPEQEQAFAELFAGCDVPTTPMFKSLRGPHRLFGYDPRLAGTGKAVVEYKSLGIRIGTCGKAAHSLVLPSLNADGTVREWLVSLDECVVAPLPDLVVQHTRCERDRS